MAKLYLVFASEEAAIDLSMASQSLLNFFGAGAPTIWEDLTDSDRDSCIGQVRLVGQFHGHFAWPATGELASQWNQKGIDEHFAVLGWLKSEVTDRKDPLLSYQLLLLSTLPERETAIPYLVITLEDEKSAKDTVRKFETSPRLARFGIKYLQGNPA